MRRIVISVICASCIFIEGSILTGCGKNGTTLSDANGDEKKTSSSFSLNHKKANNKSNTLLSAKKQKGTRTDTGSVQPLKTGSKTRYEYTMSEEIESGPGMDHSTNAGHWAGVYHDYQSNTLKISEVNLEDKTFQFSLSLVTTKECIGEINGKAKLINETPQAQFIQDPQLGPCEMIFEFDKNRSIKIKELTCMDANGNQCIFEGTYEK